MECVYGIINYSSGLIIYRGSREACRDEFINKNYQRPRYSIIFLGYDYERRDKSWLK